MFKKRNIVILIALLAVSLAASIIQAVLSNRQPLDGIAGFCSAADGKTWVAVYENDRIGCYLLRTDGVKEKSFSLSRSEKGDIAYVSDMKTDEAGRVFMLMRYSGAADGSDSVRQELVVYNTPKLLPFGRLRTVPLEIDEQFRFSQLHISTSLLLTAVSLDGADMMRRAIDLEDLIGSGSITIKNERYYPLLPDEGLYKVAAIGTDMMYLSQSGNAYLTGEGMGEPALLYPNDQMEYASYVSFISELSDGQAVIGEQQTGHILRLNASGQVEFIGEGDQAFGTLPYTCGDVLDMSFSPLGDAMYTAVVQNSATAASNLVVCVQGEFSLITDMRLTVLTLVGQAFRRLLLYFFGLLIIAAAMLALRRVVADSRKLLVKLLFSSIPLLVLALVVFGVYSYNSYQNALSGTYRTQAEDQGNLLRALFASSSFDMITSPQMYSSTEYAYLRAQMATRDVHTSSAYYVDGKLYTGVEWRLPCLYSFGIRYSASASALFREAALTGKQQIGEITDQWGPRIACVTPVGSSSGNVVFLLETSIFTAEIQNQTRSFLRNYLLIAFICIAATLILVLFLFRRMLSPLDTIIDGLERFSRGDRTVRLTSVTNDEMSDISRVFNKMASDINVQVYNLKVMGETYYRFVPKQVFRLLDKDNLADVTLESWVEGNFCVVAANLFVHPERMKHAEIREMTNQFFSIVHSVGNEIGATLLSDGASLQSLRIVCTSGEDAVGAVMNAIARIDEHNAKSDLPKHLQVSFLLHQTQMGFGICGDEDRYIPALISAEMDEILLRCEEYRRLSSRVLLTDKAYATMESTPYKHRFIGYAGDAETGKQTGLYDFYDANSPAMIRMISNTLTTFDKAVELYLQGRYYDAKNLFTVVLREDQYDNVARYYVFQCEKKL